MPSLSDAPVGKEVKVDMLTKFRNAMSAHLAARGIRDEEGAHLYLISFAATTFCVLVHVYLFIAYIFFGVRLFVWINLLSVALHCAMLLQRKKKRYKLIAMCTTVEVSLYATLTIIFNGISSYTVGYYLLIIIMQIILPYEKSRWRFTTGLIVGLAGFPAMIYSSYNPALLPLRDEYLRLLILSNICILFLGTAVQLCIGTLVRQIINLQNESQIGELSAMANTDPLTGLFNRRYAETYFTGILNIRQGISYCVAMLDIDDFKQVNDTWGHACGDKVLAFLAGFLAKNLRRSDLIFRWGGEEFLMVLENVELPIAYAILDKLRLKLADTVIQTNECDLKVTVTIGVAILDGQAPSDSIKKSDDNLYIGKQASKNVVIAS
jgi:diguanylate cyclase (GGDEF)-like protein